MYAIRSYYAYCTFDIGPSIQPEILEEEIGKVLQKPCVVMGLPDELLGQKIVLVIEAIKPLTSEQSYNFV